MKFLIFIFLLTFNKSVSELPSSTCFPEKPLRTKDNFCTNFDEICVKKDDADCNNFKSACKQCPASNYSILMFMDIMNVKNQTNFTNYRLNILEAQLESNKRETAYINKRQNEILILLCIVIVVLVICLVLLICEIRFNLLTKICKNQSTRKGSDSGSREDKFANEKSRLINPDYQTIIDSLDSKFNVVSVKMETLDSKFNVVSVKMETLDSKMNEMFVKIDKLFDWIKIKTKFKIDGYQDLFSVKFGEDDTVVKVKKILCKKISSNFKIMKMKLNGIVLDDNNILSAEIGTINDFVVIECYFDNQINASEIIVVNVAYKGMITKLIQMSKNQIIEDFKNVLSRFNITTDIMILKGTTKLDEKKSINDLQLIDNDLLTVIQIKQLTVSSVFDEQTTVTIEYSAIDKIGTLIQSIAKEHSSDPFLYALFIKNHCLDEDKYTYEYDIENESSVQYCCIKKLNGVTTTKQLHKGTISELFLAKDVSKNKEMLLLKYEVLAELKMKENQHILKEIQVFQIAKLHERFVKLLDIYHKDKIVYVAMENMSQGTAKMYMKNNSPLDLKLIHRWSIQILDGLEHLHNHEIILRDLNPNHILVDENDNVKLYSFNVSKYKEFHNTSSLQIDHNSRGFHVRYFAPEILLEELCGKGSDIWSFGAILIKLSTGKSPYGDLTKENMIIRICKSKYIEYKLPADNNNVSFKEFIDSCLKPLEKRPTVTQLKNHEFIKNFKG